MSTTNREKIIVIFMALLTVFMTVYGSIGATMVAYAASTDYASAFEQSDVLEDLNASTVNGEKFDIKDYPYNDRGALKIFSFVEYCYTYKTNLSSNYGLYVYVYNPSGINIVGNSGQNKIQLAIKTNTTDEVSYDKFNLKLCSVSSGNYHNLFYKFKVVDKQVNGKTLLERVNSNERIYCVSGVELLTKGNPNATEYGVGGTYRFTGFAHGMGPDASAESTLNCVVEDLEYCKTEVHSTYFRSNMKPEVNHYNQVNSVYFQVPKRFFDNYGKLQKIRAEWWEYKTKMALVTNNHNIYEKLSALTGYELQNNHHDTMSNPSPVYDENVHFTLAVGIKEHQMSYDDCQWSYNLRELNANSPYVSAFYAYMLPLVFESSADDVDITPSNFIDAVFNWLHKWLYDESDIGGVAGTQLARYIYNYSNDLGHGYIDCNGRQLSKDLFEDFVDDGRTMGYNDKTIDLDEDKFDLKTWDSQFSNATERAIAKFFEFGCRNIPATDGSAEGIFPIVIVDSNALLGTKEEVAQRLYINVDQVDDLREMYAQAKFVDPFDSTDELKEVVLFRFSVTDYYTAYGNMTTYNDNLSFNGFYQKQFYASQQTVFFDFDVIELTFNKDGVYHVIPVVVDPIDIINDITAPPGGLNLWKLLLLLLGLILLILLLAPIIPYIIRGIIWIITAPFKLIKKAIDSKERKTKNKSSTQVEDDIGKKW